MKKKIHSSEKKIIKLFKKMKNGILMEIHEIFYVCTVFYTTIF